MVLEDLLYVLGNKTGLTLASPEIRSLTDVQLEMEVRAGKKREERLSRMLGEHLGSYLTVDTLDSIFGISRPSDSNGAQSTDPGNVGQALASIPKAISLPLVFSLRPEVLDSFKDRAKELIDQRDSILYSQGQAEDPDLFGVRKFDLDLLEAVSRMANVHKAKVQEQGGSEESRAEDELLGIYPPGESPNA